MGKKGNEELRIYAVHPINCSMHLPAAPTSLGREGNNWEDCFSPSSSPDAFSQLQTVLPLILILVSGHHTEPMVVKHLFDQGTHVGWKSVLSNSVAVSLFPPSHPAMSYSLKHLQKAPMQPPTPSLSQHTSHTQTKSGCCSSPAGTESHTCLKLGKSK